MIWGTHNFFFFTSSVQSLSSVWLFAIPWTAAHQVSLVHYQTPKLAQTHVHWVGDAIQPSHPLWPPSSPALHLPQAQGLFQWVCSLHQVAKVFRSTGASASASVLSMNIQGWFPLGVTSLITLQSNWRSTVFSSTTVQKHQFFSAQLTLWSNSHICTLLEKP